MTRQRTIQLSNECPAEQETLRRADGSIDLEAYMRQARLQRAVTIRLLFQNMTSWFHTGQRSVGLAHLVRQ
jgi:hypothetical protein